MKIIAVFHDNNLQSGGTLSYLSVIEYLFNEGNQIIGIIPKKEGDLDKFLNNLGIKTIMCYYGGNVYRANRHGLKKVKEIFKCLLKSILSVCSAFSVSCKIKQEGYNIVYTNTSTINFGYWMSKFLRINHIWHFREFCLEDQESLRLFDKAFERKAKNSKYVITISGILNKYYKNKYNLTNTIMLYDDLSSKYIHKTNRIKCNNRINILVTGTFCDGKGQWIALKAFEKICNNNIHLYFAGKINAYAEELIQYVKDNNILNVHFCGLVKDMNQLRNDMTLSIVCSKSEAFGRTIIEDMLAGIVVIGAECGSVPELITNNYNGLTYRYGDIKSLCQVIEYAIGLDCDRNTIINNAFEFAIQFTKNNTAKKINLIIKNNLL